MARNLHFPRQLTVMSWRPEVSTLSLATRLKVSRQPAIHIRDDRFIQRVARMAAHKSTN